MLSTGPPKVHGKEGVVGSSPTLGSIRKPRSGGVFLCPGRRHRCPLAAAVEAFGSVARPPARARSRKRTISPRYLLDTERGSERSVGPDNGPEWMRERGVGVDLAPAVLPSASLGPGDEALRVLFWPYESLVV